LCAAEKDSDRFSLTLRHQEETSEGSGRYHRLVRAESWKAEETAVIVCDMWDLHHCLNAVRREAEFGPRLNEVLSEARRRGATIIHAPSGCMAAYADHPARTRAINTPKAKTIPDEINQWCKKIPSEERGKYPIDQSNGGEDDDLEEHAAWAKELASKGRNPKAPWKSQADFITIDPKQDFISDQGDEVWSILEAKGIKNVILTGVHTNMCVLGRPFGLRQMAQNDKNVVLMRDMTDTMYDPNSWPYVSHFSGTDLIISHIEKFVCPTVTSDQFIAGPAFVFKNDQRPHLAIVIGEQEYGTKDTLPKFAADHLDRDFRVTYVFADEEDRNHFPGLEQIAEADLVLISVRRRALPAAQLEVIRKFVADGKPVVGIRTASHAFSLRGKPGPAGSAVWEEFDAQVFGGNYHNHHGNQFKATVHQIKGVKHPILTGVEATFPQAGSLYQTSPLKDGATSLLTGSIEGKPAEPVAWTFKRADGGRSFYTSLGAVDDFKNESFINLLKNGIHWAAGLPVK